MNYRQSAEVENQMTSVERVIDYSKLPSEAPLDSAPGGFKLHSALTHKFFFKHFFSSHFCLFRKETSRHVATEWGYPIWWDVSSLYWSWPTCFEKHHLFNSSKWEGFILKVKQPNAVLITKFLRLALSVERELVNHHLLQLCFDWQSRTATL